MKFKFILFSLTFFMSTVLVAQKSDTGVSTNNSTNNGVLNSKQIDLRNRLEQASLITLELMKNANAKNVLLAGIRKDYYGDEQILFKDLFNPANSPAYMGTDIPSESINAFVQGFKDLLKSGKYQKSAEFRGLTNVEEFLISNNVQVYFPYSENFRGDINPAIAFDPITEDPTDVGLLFNKDRNTYSQVTIDEAYAISNPSFFITRFEGNPNTPRIVTIPANSEERGGPVGGGDDDCEQDPKRFSVTVHHVRFKEQMDPLRDGGPEFVFARGEAAYNTDGTQITGASNLARIKLKRHHKNMWRGVSTLWDSRWEFVKNTYEENEQHCLLWEEDEQTETEISMTGVNKIEAKLPKDIGVEQSLTQSINHKRYEDDDMLYNQQWDRCWFIITNNTDQGLGQYAGLCARGTNTVQFTMQIMPY